MSPLPDETSRIERPPVARFAFWSAIPLIGWIVIALSTIGMVGGVALAVTAGQPEPAVGLYWQSNTDPTAGAGVSAPLWQLLWRTDQPSVYYKSGTANTAWTKVGSGTSSGGTVTSITAGTGLSATPSNPITTSGTVALSINGGATQTCSANQAVTSMTAAGIQSCTAFTPSGAISGTPGDLAIFATSSTVGNFAGATGTGCTTGNVTTNVAISAAGAVTNTCTAIGTAGGLTGTLTAGKIPVAASSTSLADGSWSDTGTALSTSSTVALNGQATIANQVLQTGIITPAAISTTTNNYNPPGLSGASLIVQSATAASTITGLVAQPTGTVVTILNPTTSLFTVSFAHLSASSSAANQFRLPASTTWNLASGMMATFRYSGSDWQLVGGTFQEVPNFTIDLIANFNQIRFPNAQIYSTTGSANNVTLNSTTTVFEYTGAGTATITGLTGSVISRLLIVYNGTNNALTLPNLSASSTSANRFQNVGNTDVTLPALGSSATYMYDPSTNGPWHMIGLTTTTRSDAVSFTNTANAGTITLSGGTGTATVTSGAHCTCTDQNTTPTVVGCAVSSTTLTAKGTGTDVITYLCF